MEVGFPDRSLDKLYTAWKVLGPNVLRARSIMQQRCRWKYSGRRGGRDVSQEWGEVRLQVSIWVCHGLGELDFFSHLHLNFRQAYANDFEQSA